MKRSLNVAAVLLALSACGGRPDNSGLRWLPEQPELMQPASGPVVKSTKDSGSGSLRDAVAKASSGATITFNVGTPATITLLSGPIALTKNVTIAGPGASELHITAFDKSQLFTVSAKVKATIARVTLQQGAVRSGPSPSGGAIYNAGTLKLEGDPFANNIALTTATVNAVSPLARMRFYPRPRTRRLRAPRPPRAPHVRAPDASSIGHGGAVYNAAGAALTIRGCFFSANAAALGGAIYNAGGAKIISTTFLNNTGFQGGGAPLSGGYGYGAAVYSASGSVAVQSSKFTGNVAGGFSMGSFGFGGAIAHHGGSLAIGKSTFTGNVAGGGTNGSSWGYGGAIYDDSPHGLASSEDTFKSNKAGGDGFGYGGAIFAEAPIVSSGDTFDNNTAHGSAGGGYGYGGAIYATARVKLNGDSFSANSAKGGTSTKYGYAFGGALDAEGGSKLVSVTFSGNAAVGGKGGSGEGGAVFSGGTGTWNAVVFSGNTAGASGTTAYAAGGAAAAFGPLTIGAHNGVPSSFDANAAAAPGAGTLGGLGGALAIETGPLSFAGTLSNNQASTQGGALWIDGSAKISNSAISSNSVLGVQAANDGGGGLYNAIGGSLTMTGSTVNGNSIAGSALAAGGGGVFNAGDAKIANSTITANISSVDGGGFENAATGSVNLVNVTLYQNTASGSGGDLRNAYSDAAMSIGETVVGNVSNAGTVNSTDYNILVSGDAVSGTTTHDITGTDPQLSALADNGGPTKTMADSPSAPGYNLIPTVNTSCNGTGITKDQRGDARPGTGRTNCDAGAYESQ